MERARVPMNEEGCVSGVLRVLPNGVVLRGLPLRWGLPCSLGFFMPQDGPPSAPSRALPAGSGPSLPTSP